MLTCCHLPSEPSGGAVSPTAGPATSTRPSAGEITSSAAADVRRSGSRKKKRKKATAINAWKGQKPANGCPRNERQHQRAADERETGGIDTDGYHRVLVYPMNVPG